MNVQTVEQAGRVDRIMLRAVFILKFKISNLRFPIFYSGGQDHVAMHHMRLHL